MSPHEEKLAALKARMVGDKQYAAITKTWDEMAVPDQNEDEGDLQYIFRLRQTIRDIAKTANQHEAAAQKLAESNVRQTKIIERLQKEQYKLKAAAAYLNTTLEDVGR